MLLYGTMSRMLSRLFGSYIVMEEQGYGLYVRKRMRRFWLRSHAEAYAHDVAQGTNGSVVVMNQGGQRVLLQFKHGRKYKKKTLRR